MSSDVIYIQVTRWYRDEWWSSANIVATDFFLGNSVIEESVRANRRRSKDCQNYEANEKYPLEKQHVSTTESIKETDRSEGGQSSDNSSKQSSSWWSWFGF